MSQHQSRAEKTEGHIRKQGRTGNFGQHRNFSGGGKGGGRGGGGGGGAGPAPAFSVAASPPTSLTPHALTANRSFKKSDNGQGGQSSESTVSSNSNAAYRTGHGGAYSSVLSNGSSVRSAIADVKPEYPLNNQKIGRGAPKSVGSLPPAVSDAAGTSAQTKGEFGAFLQFGTINPGIVNGMQIPARTTSAPPNLDEQKRDQARHDSFRAAPALPIPSIPKPQQQQKQEKQQPKKVVEGVNKPNNGETHSSFQAKREIHATIPSAPHPNTTTTRPSIAPSNVMPMPVSFQQPQIHFQFNGPNPPLPSQGVVASSLQMPMALPGGNVTQVPHQLFVPNIQSHPLQPQAIMHQGHGLGFTPQLGHQMPSQLAGMGVGIAPQFPQQQLQFGTQRRAVKITHPDTHEELKLDKRSDSHTDAGTNGQRQLQNVSSQSQPLPAFSPSHQINYYKPSSQIFFPPSSLHMTSTQMQTGAPAVRYGYSVSQNGQAISFTNPPSSLNPSLGGRAGPPPPLHGLAEAVHSEGSSFSATLSAPVQVTIKPTPVPISEKTGKSSVRVSLPATKPEQPKLSTLQGDALSVPCQKDNKIELESSVILQNTISELVPESVSLVENDKTISTVPLIASTEINRTEASQPLHSVGDSFSVVLESDGRKKEAKKRLEPIMDHQNMSSEREPKLPQQQQDIIGANNDNVTSKSVYNDFASIPSSPTSDSSTAIIRLISTDVDSRNYRVISNTDVMRTSDAPLFSLENADQGSDHVEVTWHKHFCKEADKSQISVSSILNATGIVSETPTSVLNGPTQENLVAAEKLGGEVSDLVLLGSNSDKESAVSLTESVQTPEDIICAELDNSEGINSVIVRKSGAELDTSEGINSAVERTRDSSIPSSSPSDNKEFAAELFDQVPSTIPAGSAKSGCELACNKEIVNEFATLQPETISIPPVFSEFERNMKEEVVDQSNGIPRVMILELKDKPEPTKGKTNRKKKIKEILSKADAAGASDLYNAYKTTKETHDATVSTSESDSTCSTSESKNDTSQDCSKVATSVEEDGQYKAEVQDWEEAADSSIPKLRSSDNDAEKQNRNGHSNQSAGRKKYSRDFLMAFSKQCNDLPEGFENASDIADILNLTSAGIRREPNFSPGRLIDKSLGASRVDKRSSSISDDDKWARGSNFVHMDLSHGTAAVNLRSGQGFNNGVLRNPRNGILGGPIQSSQGGISRSNLDIDRWQHTSVMQRGLFPTPHEPLPIIHKSLNRYEIGKSTDEEEQKQRLLKAILNKLTPQNFDKLFSQVKDVEIDNALTLSGIISQIFDKALMEPTFCEMYADFCFHLASELPDFLENNEKITFRRLLLNKCQEEFERGEREQAEANKIEEEGEISQTEEGREEKKNKARRRMLGNIRLIGELYKKKMLTERIMHECIQKLLGYHQIPDEEDIESLCNLMNTIGVMIDHSRAKELMDNYFNRITILSTNEKLSSRVRFMLKDTIDLRKNKWQQRRKIEGPKKIEDVHKDAAQERQAQTTRLTRGQVVSSRRGGPPANFGHWASTNLNSPSSQANPSIRSLPTQARGFSSQDVRHGDRQLHEGRVISVPLPQRPSDDGSITLGPQGGLAKGMSGRGLGLIPNVPLVEISLRAGDPHRFVSGSNVSASASDRMTSTSREDITNKYMNDRLSGASNDPISFHVRNSHFSIRDSHAAGTNTSMERPVSSSGKVRESNDAKLFDSYREKSISAVREFYSAEDKGEFIACIKELNAPHFYPSMVSEWVTDSFERQTLERNLLAELLVSLNKSHNTLISQTQLISGFESALSSLEDAIKDAPKAAEYLGHIFGKVIVENVVSLKEIGRLIRDGGEEPGGLVEFGLASEILLGILKFIKKDKGDSVLNEILRGSLLRLEDFRPQKPTEKSKMLDAFL